MRKHAQVPAKVIYFLRIQLSRKQMSLPTKFFGILQTAISIHKMKTEDSNVFQWKKFVLCQQQTPPLHILPIYSFSTYLAIKDHVNIKDEAFYSN